MPSIVVRLPSEVEWEFAARGATGRQYPWKRSANEDWVEGDELRCNMDATGINRTSAVGMFPNGATPEGVLDLSGNVWEWLRTTYKSDWRKGSDELEGDASRVLRGGSFNDNSNAVRAVVRFNLVPHLDGWSSGFRVVLLPSSTSGR